MRLVPRSVPSHETARLLVRPQREVREDPGRAGRAAAEEAVTVPKLPQGVTRGEELELEHTRRAGLLGRRELAALAGW